MSQVRRHVEPWVYRACVDPEDARMRVATASDGD
jgi:hypothetical protein